MILFENTEEKASFEDIIVDYEVADASGLNVEKPEAVLYFNSDRKLTGIDDIIIPIRLDLEFVGKKYVTISYSPNSFDENFDVESMPDDIYEVDEIPGSDGAAYMVTVNDIDGLSKVMDVEFTKSVIYPFDNTSKNDKVNKYLERDDIDTITKIEKYRDTLVYQVDEYKAIHSSGSNMKTRAEKKAKAEEKVRAGRSDLEMFRDGIKAIPGVKSVQVTKLNMNKKYSDKIRVFATATRIIKGKATKNDIVVDVLCDAKVKHFVCRTLNDAFNGAELWGTENVMRWLKNKLNVKQAAAKDTDLDDNGWGNIADTADLYTRQ